MLCFRAIRIKNIIKYHRTSGSFCASTKACVGPKNIQITNRLEINGCGRMLFHRIWLSWKYIICQVLLLQCAHPNRSQYLAPEPPIIYQLIDDAPLKIKSNIDFLLHCEFPTPIKPFKTVNPPYPNHRIAYSHLIQSRIAPKHTKKKTTKS